MAMLVLMATRLGSGPLFSYDVHHVLYLASRLYTGDPGAVKYGILRLPAVNEFSFKKSFV